MIRRPQEAQSSHARLRARCQESRAPIHAATKALYSTDTVGVVLLEEHEPLCEGGGGGATGSPPPPSPPPSEAGRIGYRPRPPAWWEVAVVILALAIELAITAHVARMAADMLTARRRAAGGI